VTSDSDISREAKRTRPSWWATWWAIDCAKAGEAGGQAGVGVLGVRDALQALELVADGGGEGARGVWAHALAEGEDALLEAADQGGAIVLGGGGVFQAVVEGVQDGALVGEVLHDAAVVASVAGGGGVEGELVDRGAPAGVLESAAALQAVGEGEGVDRLAGEVEVEDRPVDVAVLGAVEVIGAQAVFDRDAEQEPRGEEQRAEHRLLGLDAVRRDGRWGHAASWSRGVWAAICS